MKLSQKSLTVKLKLVIIGILFFTSIFIVELFATYSNTSLNNSINAVNTRNSDLALLAEMEVSLVEFVLAGMDAIIDKDTGNIDQGLINEMETTSSVWRENLPKLKKIAEGTAEQQLVAEVTRNYPKLEKEVLTTLPKLITSQADQAAFEKIDDAIDQMLGDVDEPLMAFISKVEQKNEIASEAMNHQITTSNMTRRLFALAMLGIIGAVLLFIGRSILSPITAARDMVQDVAQGEGDLTKRLVSSSDEVGQLSGWFNTFMEKLHKIISDVQKNLITLNDSSTELSTLADTLASGADDATERSNAVAAAAEQMSANMNAVAAASEQASVNVNMVASAAEEMNATVNEITGNTAKARHITEQAVSKTEATSVRVDDLGNAANEISKVTEVITEISEQTNLLALNATIEAARAGEAGKGFAVVANEIKELAKQTAEATQEIRQKIEAIQSSTNLTVTDINEINATINDVNDIVTTIATAVEEQSASTNEIASNIAQAAQGIAEVTENVSQSSTVSAEISQEIAGVSKVAEQLKINSISLNNQSTDLSGLADKLAGIVKQFQI